jgi:predicted Zn-dependent protease
MTSNERLGALYGGALASLLLGDVGTADAAVARALELLRGRSPAVPAAERSLRELQVQVVLQRGDAVGAMKMLDSAALQPASRWTMLLRGQVALALWNLKPQEAAACLSAPRPASASTSSASGGCDDPLSGYRALRASQEALQSWVSLHPNDPLAWSLLAQAEEATGQRLRALRAQAESRAALGDINGAVDRLRAAQTLARSGAGNDFIEASVIDARLRQLDAQRREIAAEMRGGR